MSETGLTVPGMAELPCSYDVTEVFSTRVNLAFLV